MRSIPELEFGKNHDEVLIGEPAEAKYLALGIDDVTDNLLKAISKGSSP